MTCNMGKADRMVRGVLGIVIAGLGLAMGSWWGLIGLIPLTTAFVRWCPLYVPLGLDTREKDAE